MSFADDPVFRRDCIEIAAPGSDLFVSSLADVSEALIPNEPMDIVQWAYEFVILPPEVSERSGACELPPFQASILRMAQRYETRQVTHQKPPRIGSSLMTAIQILYYACHEGLPCIYYERSDGAAQDFHDKVLYPILMASPRLSHLVRPRTKAGVQDAWSDIILRNGAAIQLRSASNNGSFRAIKGAKIFTDEVSSKEWQDRSKNGEGSKLGLARRRSQQYAQPLLYAGSTPTKLGECVISAEYSRSDKRVYRMPCPRCQASITFEPDVRRADSRKSRYGAGLRYTINAFERVDDAWYECGECGGQIEEFEKIGMLDKGEWVARDPNGEAGHVGLFNWAAHSTDPQSSWIEIGKEHRKTLADPGTIQDYTNTILSLAYSVSPIALIDPTSLESRTEVWLRPDGSKADCPEWAEAIFGGIDCQQGSLDDVTKPPRLEITLLAVGRNRRRAVIDHIVVSHREVVDRFTGEIERVPVEPFTSACSDIVWDILERDYLTADGRALRVRRTFVDNGWRPDDAQRLCRLPRSKAAGIIPIRGSTTERAGTRVSLLPVSLQLAKGRKSGREYLWIGTQTAKDTLGRVISIPAPGPESIVFAAHLERPYFEGLLAEHLVELKPNVRAWRPIKASNTGEPLDCLVYAYAAERYEVRKNSRLKKVIDEIDPEAAEAALLAQAEALVPPAEPPLMIAEPPLQGSGSDGDAPAQEAVSPSGLRMRVVERKTRRTETTPEASSRIERIRRRQSRSGVGW